MATEPLRLRIQMALSDALREITPGNGYVHDLSGAEATAENKVFRGRAVFGEGDPLPMVSILEPPLPPDQIPVPDASGSTSGRWEMVIQGFVQDDKKHPTDPAQRLVADVLQRLAIEKRREATDHRVLGFKRIKRLIIGPPVVRPPDDLVSSKAYFWLSISIDLAEDLTQPYAD
jgi:hypothetical protein